ncbi:uncharacterized protein J3R85_004655 [Psidium guajava]|nr:uncharacterized protein J3R85_004655 [Psidium guajava]
MGREVKGSSFPSSSPRWKHKEEKKRPANSLSHASGEKKMVHHRGKLDAISAMNASVSTQLVMPRENLRRVEEDERFELLCQPA